jgi:hypothetical protein
MEPAHSGDGAAVGAIVACNHIPIEVIERREDVAEGHDGTDVANIITITTVKLGQPNISSDKDGQCQVSHICRSYGVAPIIFG